MQRHNNVSLYHFLPFPHSLSCRGFEIVVEGRIHIGVPISSDSSYLVCHKQNGLKCLHLWDFLLMRELPSSTAFCRALGPPQAARSYAVQPSPLGSPCFSFYPIVSLQSQGSVKWKGQRNVCSLCFHSTASGPCAGLVTGNTMKNKTDRIPAFTKLLPEGKRKRSS